MTEASKEAVEAFEKAMNLAFEYHYDPPYNAPISECVKVAMEMLGDSGFTIAPIAPVTDEKLREAVEYWEPNATQGSNDYVHWAVIKAALSELAQRRAEETWQKIETAPKDGAKVLLGRFVPSCPEDKNGRMAVDFWHTVNPHAYEGWGQFNTRYWPATHWMPLPTPPKED